MVSVASGAFCALQVPHSLAAAAFAEAAECEGGSGPAFLAARFLENTQ